jgi:hypothetical protein
MGIPEYEAKRYEGRVKGGGTLLSVHCDTPEQISRAKDMLKGGISVTVLTKGSAWLFAEKRAVRHAIGSASR